MGPMSTTTVPVPAVTRTAGTWQVFVAGAALVVSASTLVTDVEGFTRLGWGFAVALGLAFLVIVPLALSAADLAAAYPRGGAIFHYAKAVIGGRAGQFVGTMLGLCFLGMFLFGASGETMAAARALRALGPAAVPTEVWAVALAGLAVVPALLGLRTAAWITAGLVLTMFAIRFGLGAAGFLGWSQTGPWSAAHLVSAGGLEWTGPSGIVNFGLAFAFWTFVGIEGVCALAGEARQPARSIPRGMLGALVAVLVLTLTMGLGTVGTMPLTEWSARLQAPLAQAGESSQLVLGELMFGAVGRWAMALATLAAALGGLSVAFAAVPRILRGIAGDGLLLGSLSHPLAKVDPRTGVPTAATLTTFGLFLGVLLAHQAVLDCLYAAAYLWVLRYVVVHLLALARRMRRRGEPGAFRGRWFNASAALGLVATLATFHLGFAGRHADYGPRALVVIGAALALTSVSFLIARRSSAQNEPVPAGRTAPAPV
jgi:amino acid transporter